MKTEYSEAISSNEEKIERMTSLYVLSINMGEFKAARMLNDIIYDLHWDNYSHLMKDISLVEAKIDLDPWNSEDLRDARRKLALKRKETIQAMDDLIKEDFTMPV